jgi:hypothetical protein
MIDVILHADWLKNGVSLFYHMDYWPGQFFIAKGITVTATLADVPEGNHTLTVTANEYTGIAGSASVHFTIDSSPTSTAALPTPLDDPSYPEGLNGWLPLGTFGFLSPLNQTYTTNSLTVSVGGVIIAGNPYLAYSLDGAPRKPIPIQLKKPEGLNVTMQRQMSGSVTLPPLANGAHVIVLFADLGVEGRKGKETVYFDVEAV